MISCYWLRLLYTKSIIIFTPASKCIAIGIAVIFIPVFFIDSKYSYTAAWRVGGLLLGFIAYFTLIQIPWHRKHVLTALYGVIFVVVIESVFACQQILYPQSSLIPVYNGRIYGTFFQPNVLASFIATGICLVLVLLVLPEMSLRKKYLEHTRQSFLLILLCVLTFLTVCIQSRTGWIGGLFSSLMFFYFAKTRSLPTRMASIAIIIGFVLGFIFLQSDHDAFRRIDHGFSNHARWTMLHDTIKIISERPWIGWGYGSFEYEFQHFRINQIQPTLIVEITRHPHNEILLWVMEGGIMGIAGIILVLKGGIRVLRQATQKSKENVITGVEDPGTSYVLCITLLPIVIHTQLEYPFYQSTIHYITFIIILAMADRISTSRNEIIPMKSRISTILTAVLLIITVNVAVLSIFALKGERIIQQVERFGMEDITPLRNLPFLSRTLFFDRVEFDEQVGELMIYNQTNDKFILENYSVWAEKYLQHRIDKNVYANLVNILRHQQKWVKAEYFRREASLFFPNEHRFYRQSYDVQKRK